MSCAAGAAAAPLPPLVHNTSSLAAAVRGGTLGTGYAAGGARGGAAWMADGKTTQRCAPQGGASAAAPVAVRTALQSKPPRPPPAQRSSSRPPIRHPHTPAHAWTWTARHHPSASCGRLPGVLVSARTAASPQKPAGGHAACSCRAPTADRVRCRPARHPSHHARTQFHAVDPRSFIGVSKALQQLGIVRRGEVRTAGSSVGALAMVGAPRAARRRAGGELVSSGVAREHAHAALLAPAAREYALDARRHQPSALRPPPPRPAGRRA